jgi:glycosyltransferase involved in cell wall biosynthesis
LVSQLNNLILADGRWSGAYGIGRFSTEILSRLHNVDIFKQGPRPLAVKNFFWQAYQLQKKKNSHRIFFTPGFNPVNYSPIPFIVTICDLIHLYAPGKAKLAKKIFYQLFMKPSAQKAYKVLTLSEFSKQSIVEWANIPAEKVVVVYSGISQHFTPAGSKYQADYPYLLHVGNTKPHKNIERFIQAFAIAKIDPAFKLLLTGELTPALAKVIYQHHLTNRIVFTGTLSEEVLGNYYRGATALVFPSLYEGFGLPVLEAMGCGIPVLTANTTSLPEVAGNAALLINPLEIEAIAQGIEKIIYAEDLRKNLVEKGFQRTKLFSWDKTASKVQTILDEALRQL